MHKCLITAAGSGGQSKRVTIPPGYLEDWNKTTGDILYVDWSEVFRASKQYEELLEGLGKKAARPKRRPEPELEKTPSGPANIKTPTTNKGATSLQSSHFNTNSANSANTQEVQHEQQEDLSEERFYWWPFVLGLCLGIALMAFANSNGWLP